LICVDVTKLMSSQVLCFTWSFYTNW